MMKTGDVIKSYLKAKNPETLKVLMLNNNIKRAAYHSYDIVFADGFWFAWYEVSADQLLKEQVVKIGANR